MAEGRDVNLKNWTLTLERGLIVEETRNMHQSFIQFGVSYSSTRQEKMRINSSRSVARTGDKKASHQGNGRRS